MRCILTSSGIEFRRCCNSWSVVEVGTKRPLRLLLLHQHCFTHFNTVGFFRIPRSQSPHYPRPRDRRTTYGYHILQFRFEDAVEILRGANASDGVCVGEGGKDANPVVRLSD